MTTIRTATPDERARLIELMRRASLVWDDTRDQLVAQPELIDVPVEQIEAGRVWVAVDADSGALLGFAALLRRDDGDVELDGLFTEPARFRQGIGRALVHAAEVAATALGAQRLHVLANCNVLAFYEAVGFEAIGDVATPLGPVASRMQKRVDAA